MRYNLALYCAIIIGCVVIFAIVHAQEFTSSNFRVLDPVIFPAGFSTSANFRLFGTVSQISIGTSTASTYKVNSGFLYFPFVSSPVVSATAGDAQVSLSWNAVTGFLGWTVSGYNVGQSTSAGGPYTYTSLGNVTSSTRTGLTNGTAYYFIVRPEDAFSNAIATSSEVSATPVAAPPPPPSPTPAPSPSPGAQGNGPIAGGGAVTGGGAAPGTGVPATQVILKGLAYPGATMYFLKDGSDMGSVIADANGDFEKSMDVAGGIYTFSMYAKDAQGKRSLTFSFTTNVSLSQAVTISDFIIPPTISSNKAQVKFGNDIKFFGYTYPESQVNVIINSEDTYLDKTLSNKFGLWIYTLNSGNVEKGDHSIKSQTVVIAEDLVSPFSESLAFKVGDQDVAFGKAPKPLPTGPVCSKKGDINADDKINIVDFSIMLYFWDQANPKNPCADINQDGIVNLIDFSIMLFWWTG